MEQNVIKSTTMKSAFLAGIFTGLSPVRTNNENGYPFITLLGKGNTAQNIYFGKKSADKVAKGDVLTAALVKDAQFVLTTNAAGEPRIKLSLGGDTEYVQASSLFGEEVADDDTAKVIAALKAGMTVVEAQQPVNNNA